MSIVGSTTTGNRRPACPSHPASAASDNPSVPVAASQVVCWATFGLHANPYGDEADGVASVMNGLGSTSAGTPSRVSAIDPSRCAAGVSPPPARTLNRNPASDDAAAADASVIRSFSDCGV